MGFLQPAPKEALLTGAEFWLAENRWVSVVFLIFSLGRGDTLTAAQARPRLARPAPPPLPYRAMFAAALAPPRRP